jgi:ClpP class serine protease
MVDQYYAAFVAGVARGRGVAVGEVRTNYGQGRLLTAREGLAAGMVDRIATMDETLSRVLTGKRGQGARALDEPAPIIAAVPSGREARERRLALARLR